MPALPVDLAAMEDALARWAGATSGLQPFWADQNAPHPPVPDGMVVLTYLARWRGIGGSQPDKQVVSTGLLTAEARIQTPVEAAISMKVIARGRDAAAQAALALELGLRDAELWEPVKAAGLSWTGELTRTTVPEVMGALMTDMEVLDIRLRASLETTRPQNWIESSGPRAVEVTVDGLVHIVVWT